MDTKNPEIFNKMMKTQSDTLIKVLSGTLTAKDCNYLITLINRDLENTNNTDEVKVEEQKQRIKLKLIKVRNIRNKVSEYQLTHKIDVDEESE